MKHTLTIEKVIPGGKGLARTADGQVIMTPFTLSNEKVLIREHKKKSGYLEGSLDKVLLPSPARIKPPCPLYGKCGGCNLQHGSYTEQLKIKKGIVAESLQRAKVPIEQVRETVASPAQWGYRYRLRLKISPAGQLGFFKKRSNTFIPVTNCPVATQGICSAVVELNKSGVLRPLAKVCPELEVLESPADGKITLVLRENKENPLPTSALREVGHPPHINQVGWLTRNGFQSLFPQAAPLTQHIQCNTYPSPSGERQQSMKGDRTTPRSQRYFHIKKEDCILSWSGGCFSQVNPGQNEQLIRLVCEAAGDLNGKTVLDLYCGMGNFSVPLGRCSGTVTGIEGNQESIHWAEKNARQAEIKARFFVADVRSALEQLVEQGEQADLILLDPPRSGVGKNIILLPQLEPEKIIYVSCDPATLARDLNLLCPAGYQISRVIPVDMFPQTSHIETVVLLERL